MVADTSRTSTPTRQPEPESSPPPSARGVQGMRSHFDSNLRNAEFKQATTSGSVTGHMAEKVAGNLTSDEKLKEAVRKFGDVTQEEFSKLFTGYSTQAMQTAEFEKQATDKLTWYQTTTRAARNAAREKARIDMELLSEDVKLDEQELETNEVVATSRRNLEKRRKEIDLAGQKMQADIEAMEQNQKFEVKERERNNTLRSHFSNIVASTSQQFTKVIAEVEKETAKDADDLAKKLKQEIADVAEQTKQATAAQLKLQAEEQTNRAQQAQYEAHLILVGAQSKKDEREAEANAAQEDNKRAAARRLQKKHLVWQSEDASFTKEEKRIAGVQEAKDAAADRDAEAEKLNVLFTGLKSYDDNRRMAWNRVKELLKCTDDDLNLDRSNNCMMSLARFCFLLVILGCELDIWGYGLAQVTYWNPPGLDPVEHCNFFDCAHATHSLMHCLLVIGPVGYVCAIILKGVMDMNDEDADPPRSSAKKPLLDADDPEANVRSYKQLDVPMAKEPCSVYWYHIVPVMRNYLLVKEQEPNDVEALFRVNGLSTFTLGFSQIACMVLGLSKGWLHLTIVLKIGIFAQTVNVIMTLLYFATPIPVMMQTSTSIDAMIDRERKSIQRDLTRFNAATQEYALKGKDDDTSKKVVETFHKKVEREIKESAHLSDLDLSPFPFQDKLGIIFYLRSKKINQYIDVCKLGTPWQKQTSAS